MFKLSVLLHVATVHGHIDVHALVARLSLWHILHSNSLLFINCLQNSDHELLLFIKLVLYLFGKFLVGRKAQIMTNFAGIIHECHISVSYVDKLKRRADDESHEQTHIHASTHVRTHTHTNTRANTRQIHD